MTQANRIERVDSVRRKLLKSSLVAGGFLAAGHIPYAKPAVKSFFGVRSAWAQPSGVTMVSFTGNLPVLAPTPGPVPLPNGTGQDAWQFDTTQPNTILTINAMVTSGVAMIEIGLFGPGVPTTGVNLLTGVPGGYNGALPVSVTAATVGTYTLAIESSQINALQTAFSYKLDITAGAPIVAGAQVINDGAETLAPAGSG